MTVLLVMEPRGSSRSRRKRRTGDPVLCVDKGCYISNGATREAKYFPRWKAMGPGVALGRRAGACRHQLTCVFRQVKLAAGASTIQPVDLGYLRHSRREVERARPDETCTFARGQLKCATTVVSGSYRAWIIPEAIAAKAGPAALEQALAAGLPSSRSAALHE